MNWRNNLDSETRKQIENLIEETYGNSIAYNTAKNPALAQLWCAMGVLAKKLSNSKKSSAKPEAKPEDKSVKPVKKLVKQKIIKKSKK